jgi:thioredoxin-like negative regulator of GroEL
MMAGRVLRTLQEELQNFEINEVDIISHPLVSLKNGIRMIPTLVMDGRRLSGIFLDEKQIREFLSKS